MADSRGVIDNRTLSRCPRCLRDVLWAEMAWHLWTEHRLVLDGSRVREPWALIKDWVEAYAAKGPAWLLVRCRQLAGTLDAERGPKRLQRLLLLNGIPDPEAREELLREAAANLASVCPGCFNLVPCPQTISFQTAVAARGRVSARGYTVQITETGFVSRLVIETPDTVVYDGPEPGRKFTFAGKALLGAGPFVLAALVCAFVLGQQSLVPVSLLLLAALAIFAMLQYRRGIGPDATNRAVDHAWRALAPRLHAGGFSPRDAEFLAGLALATAPGLGNRRKRKRVLRQLLKRTANAMSENAGLTPYLAPLWRLVVEDTGRAGRDPVEMVVREVALCFEGKLRLTFAEQLLAGWDELFARGEWGDHAERRLNAVRCRVLLLDRAFEAGLEVRDLYFAGLIAPSLGEMLGTGDLAALADYRLLWSLRASRPWDLFGAGQSAFELAHDMAAAEPLASRPGLLLNCTDVPGLWLDVRGVMLRETLFTQAPTVIEVRGGSDFLDERKVFYLVLGNQRFRFSEDPQPYVGRLERWFRYYFQDFRPKVKAVREWRPPQLAPMFDDPGVFRCSTCRRLIVPQRGAMAIAADELSASERDARAVAEGFSSRP